MNRKTYTDRTIRIYDRDQTLLREISPQATESCMNPGTFRIAPVIYQEEGELVIIENPQTRFQVEMSKVASGEIVIEVDVFEPQIIRKKGCKPCTNCGACSW